MSAAGTQIWEPGSVAVVQALVYGWKSAGIWKTVQTKERPLTVVAVVSEQIVVAVREVVESEQTVAAEVNCSSLSSLGSFQIDQTYQAEILNYPAIFWAV